MKILFVCKHNRFRSKVAEALFIKHNKKPNIEVESAGIIDSNIRVAESVKEIMSGNGAPILYDKPRKLTQEMVETANKIIIVADNVSQEGFPKEKLEIWGIPDAGEFEIEKINKIINSIETKVKNLVNKLK